MQYLYKDADGFVFMDTETYDQITLAEVMVGDLMVYLKEGNNVAVTSHDGKPLTVELPGTVELEVTETDPAMKGQTAASSYKPAILSNGMRTLVPPHIGVGTKIVVMTADGSYAERAK